MLFMRQTFAGRQKLTIAALFYFKCVIAVWFIGGGGCLGSQDTRQFSWSIAEAKKKGSFVSEVQIVPNSLSFAGKKITFEAAWLERQPDGDYALCFRIDEGKEVFKEVDSPIFVRGDRGASFNERHGRNWLQFVELLDSDDLSSVRASLVQTFKQDRPNDIRFVRKDK